MDPRETILGLYPKARITSGRRDPNSALGRANPRSYHNVGRAYDFAPIPGVKFDDFVSSIRNAGVNVVEARDEVTNPSRHATGPHWHIAYGDKPAMPRRPDPITRALAPSMLNEAPLFDQSPDMMGTQMAMQQPTQMQIADQIPGKKPGAFSKDGIGWKIAGILGDAMLGYAGQRPIYAPHMASLQEQEAEDRRFREKLNMEHGLRMQELAARAQEPTDLEQRVAALNRLGAGLGDTYAKNYASNGGSSLQIWRDPGTGQSYQMGGAPSSKTINGVTYYNINGKWYDNPEGR